MASGEISTATIFFLVLFIFGLSLSLIWLTISWFYRRSEAILKRWTRENNYDIVDKKLNWFNRGPFFWTSSTAQTVYYVEIYDRSRGQKRKGWVRCGSFWGGLFSAKAEVRWDDGM